MISTAERFFGQASCQFPINPVSSSPSSLLIPEYLWSFFIQCLRQSNNRTGILLRKLLYRYRTKFYSGEFLQVSSAKRTYQVVGQDLIKISFRVEDAVWIEFGQMAAYLGVSRCLFFKYLLEAAAEDGFANSVGTPATPLAQFDLERPACVRYCEDLIMRLHQCARKIELTPLPYSQVPFFIRFETEYPLRI
jgi:hypothetical protein